MRKAVVWALVALLLCLLAAISVRAQAQSWSYTITWPPQAGTIGFVWLDAPATGQQAMGDLASGTATVGVPMDGNTYHLLLTIMPAGAAGPSFATIAFYSGKATVTYDPKNPAPLPLQIT
jgi:hypothetical protein